MKKNTKKQEDLELAKFQDDSWFMEDEDGQLAIDVYQDDKNIIIKSAIAGVKPKDIDVSINNGTLTIRGHRKAQEEILEENYLYRECYFGNFSRSIILPHEIKADKVDASLENGVLTIVLPKTPSKKQVNIKIKEK